MKKRRVVITGVGLVSCFGSYPDTFFKALCDGKSGVKLLDNLALPNLATQIGAPVQGFGLEPYFDKKEARRIDPAIGFAVGAGWMAIDNAKLDLHLLDTRRIGAVIGSGIGGMKIFVEGVEAMVTKGLDRVSPFFVPFILTNMPSAYLAMKRGLKGPVYSVSTACATSNHSFYHALRHIEHGEADVMLAGGVEASMNVLCYSGFCAMRALSRRNESPTEASRPWDKNRDGFVIGEGSAVFVFEELEHAKKRGANILAEVTGAAINCDAYHITEPNPAGEEVARCIEMALDAAHLTIQDIDYINAHATSTLVGDLCEVRALKKVFGSRLPHIPISATKSMIGHGLGAASSLEALATIQSIRTGIVHPTINPKQKEEEVEGLDLVENQAKRHPVRHAISNSFGFGGHNSVLVFSKYENDK